MDRIRALKTTLASLLSPAPYHLLSYSMMLGSSIYHTFINQNVHFPYFDKFSFPPRVIELHSRYLLLQSVLPIVIALTFPSPRGIRALWDPENRVRAMLPIACMLGTAIYNKSVILPRAERLLGEIRELEKTLMREQLGGREYKRRTMLAEQKIDRLTLWMDVSGVVNFVTLLGAVAYGASLAARLR